MVTSLLVIGNESAFSGGAGLEVGRAATAAEALTSLSHRAWDVVLVGSVPDATAEAFITNLTRRYPSIPVLATTARVSEGIRSAVWEIVDAGAAGALADAIGRAAEVARLRREVERLGADREDRLVGGEETRTFERGSIREMERLMIVARLDRLNQNRTHSAASLDISVRTLRNKLREYREAAAPETVASEGR